MIGSDKRRLIIEKYLLSFGDKKTFITIFGNKSNHGELTEIIDIVMKTIF